MRGADSVTVPVVSGTPELSQGRLEEDADEGAAEQSPRAGRRALRHPVDPGPGAIPICVGPTTASSAS